MHLKKRENKNVEPKFPEKPCATHSFFKAACISSSFSYLVKTHGIFPLITWGGGGTSPGRAEQTEVECATEQEKQRSVFVNVLVVVVVVAPVLVVVVQEGEENNDGGGEK